MVKRKEVVENVGGAKEGERKGISCAVSRICKHRFGSNIYTRYTPMNGVYIIGQGDTNPFENTANKKALN